MPFFSFILYFRVCTKRYIGYNRVCTKWWTTCKQGMYKLVYTPMYQLVATPMYHLVATYKIKYIIKYIFILRKRKRKRKKGDIAFIANPHPLFYFCMVRGLYNIRDKQTDTDKENRNSRTIQIEQGDALKASFNC